MSVAGVHCPERPRACSGAIKLGVPIRCPVSVRLAFASHPLGQTEVHYPRLAIGTQQDVPRLEIAVHDARIVSALHRARDLGHQARGFRAVARSPLPGFHQLG